MLLATLLAAAAPTPGELKTFNDWIVGCDNGRACQAVALLPEDWSDGALLAIARGPEANATPRIWVTLRTEGAPSPSVLRIDDRRFPLRLDAGSQELRVVDAAAAAAMLGQATRIEALVTEGTPRGFPVSVRGSAAALLYIDEQQRRLGTTSALVRRGRVAAVPAPPALPVVAGARPARARGLARLGPERAAQLRARNASCDTEPTFDPKPEAHKLDDRTTLFIIPCWLAAYNSGSLVMVAARPDASDLKPARFDFLESAAETTKPGDPVDGAYWDEETGRLATYFKGRGLGDCGVGQTYAWDGAMFRLVEQIAMGECRGSTDYITTWRARVVTR